MIDLILNVANSDERIRGVMLVGSRANASVPKDCYQDYDISFAVTDMKPFFNNPSWAEEKFGKPVIMQMPETLRGADDDGNFIYLMIFPDGARIDLSFIFDEVYIDDGEPAIVLLDKDNGNGFFPQIKIDKKHWSIKPPTALDYRSCCSNFWWLLNNVAKGIKRDELPYVMSMINEVRGCLLEMIDWYIGVEFGFDVSTGKDGKFIKNFLPPEIYAQYAASFSDANYENIWKSIDVMCGIFPSLAVSVAEHFGFLYHHDEENGMREYLKIVCSKG